jgi:hypothetical protein
MAAGRLKQYVPGYDVPASIIIIIKVWNITDIIKSGKI